jgi:hypothetical protein
MQVTPVLIAEAEGLLTCPMLQVFMMDFFAGLQT